MPTVPRPAFLASALAAAAALVLGGSPESAIAQAPAQASAAASAADASASRSAKETASSSASFAERLAKAEPRQTSAGHAFTAPEGFSLQMRPAMVVLQPPEADTTLSMVDVGAAPSADEAVARAWQLAHPGFARKLLLATPRAAREGWEERRFYDYETSPNERVVIQAIAHRVGGAWLVVTVEGSESTLEKRGASIGQIASSLRPKGYARESFAGRKPNALDAARIDALKAFIAKGMKDLNIPGVGFSLIDGGKVVFEGGLGVRTLGRPEKVDAHTVFMAASNTKAMTTFLLATAVDEGKLRWDQPVVEAFPAFRLADPVLTKKVLVKHLVCACTGMPRQDMEWLFKGARADAAASTFDTLGRASPTSAFGEAFQYSNLMVAAGGYVAAHAISPGKEVGAAYDEAMQDRLFAPLGMKATTFDFGRALRSNHAEPHGEDIDGRLHRMTMTMNPKIIPARPAGGVWTSAHDLSRFVEMELALGRNLEGKRLVSERNLLTRREPQVLVAEDVSYGMGLIIDKSLGIEWIEHNGSMDGYKSIMMWLPDYGIGATLLTNAESGSRLEGPFVRKLLELVFDGKPEADERLRLSAEVRRETARKDRATLTVPPEPAVVAQLAPRYFNEDLGPITITRSGKRLFFALTELRSEMVSRKNADGTTSLITADPGLSGLEFLVAKVEGQPQLILRDAQHEYVFTASPLPARRKGPSA